MIGTAALRGSRREPSVNSCLSSSPTTKKKTVRIPSDAQCSIGRARWTDPGPTTVVAKRS